MTQPLLRILIPALLADADDGRRLAATLAGLPPGLDAVAHPIVQTDKPELLPPSLRPEDARLQTPVFAVETPTRPGDGAPPISGAAADGPAGREPAVVDFVRPDHPACPVEPLMLGAPSGKWGAIRAAAAACGPCEWIAIADGDDAYDLVVLPAILWRAQGWEGDLFQGQRGRIVLDPTDLGRRRALLEPVVNELLRLRLAARGVGLDPAVTDLQSGLMLVRRALLDAFLAAARMDGADPGAAPGPLPWGAYGGELHLHAFAARERAQVRGHPVRARDGRISGQGIAAIGRQLQGSIFFAGTGAAELAEAAAAAARQQRWDAGEAAAALAAGREAFPQAI